MYGAGHFTTSLFHIQHIFGISVHIPQINECLIENYFKASSFLEYTTHRIRRQD